MTIEYAELSHYTAIATIIALNSTGVGIGEGLANQGTIQALNIQPAARNDIYTTMILGSALMETAAILACVMVIILLVNNSQYPHTEYSSIGLFGITAALAIPGFFIGILSSYAVHQSCLSIARQPLFGSQILRFMLVCQSIIQTPVIFGFIIAMLIKNQCSYVSSIGHALGLLAAGISIGVGSIGSIIGLGIFAQNACRQLGINRHAYATLLPFSFLSQAIIETPTLLSLAMSLFIITFGTTPTLSFAAGMALLAASLCIGIGTIAPGISSGITASSAVIQISLAPEHSSHIARTSLFAQGIIDTTAIYMFLISLALFFLSHYL